MIKAALPPIKILLVEDNPGDIRLTQEALKDSKIRNTLDVVHDGDEALAYLRNQDPYPQASRPDMILLDLDMPNMSGRELLEVVKSDDALKRIPIIILTVSQSDKDVLSSYDMNANAFVNKPLDLDQFVRVIQTIEEFWFTIAKLPSGSR